MANYGFHLEALLEYAEATVYLVRESSASVAARFVESVESVIKSVVAAPDRWIIVESQAFVAVC
jgi:hypothetical protein